MMAWALYFHFVILFKTIFCSGTNMDDDLWMCLIYILHAPKGTSHNCAISQTEIEQCVNALTPLTFAFSF